MLPLLIPLAAAGASLAGSLFGQKNQSDINQQNIYAQQYQNEANRQLQASTNAQNIAYSQQANALALADKEKDRQLQQDFAQMGIQWRVKDAEAAGVHPVFAMGSGGASYSPSAISLSTPSLGTSQGTAPRSVAGNNFANMGQDISRALLATQSQSTRNEAFESASQEMQLKNMALRNTLLSSQIARLSQAGGVGPAKNATDNWPGTEKIEESTQTPILRGGQPIGQIRGDSDAQVWEDRYDEVGAFIGGALNMQRDLRMNEGAAYKYFQWVNQNMIADQMRDDYFRKLNTSDTVRRGGQWERRDRGDPGTWKGHW